MNPTIPSLVGWGCRTTSTASPPPTNERLGYDIKPSDRKAPALENVPLLPGPL